jgi:hypothetical protein
VISTNPTMVVGNGRTEYTAPLAVIGRVPVKVSSENGAIRSGDLLVTASLPGYAMKFGPSTVSGSPAIVGIALESFDASTPTSTILILVRSGWATQTTQNSQPQDLTVSQSSADILNHNIPADVDLGGYALLGVSRVASANGSWEITGTGQLVNHVATNAGALDLYTIQTDGPAILVSGSSQLSGGVVNVVLDDRVSAIIDNTRPIRVSVSLTGVASGVYVTDKSSHGFTVHEVGGNSNATFDWMLLGFRPNFSAPSEEVTAVQVTETSVPEEASVDQANTTTTEPTVVENAGSSDEATSTETTVTSEPESSIVELTSSTPDGT